MAVSDSMSYSADSTAVAPTNKAEAPPKAVARYILTLICVAAFFNFLDRQIFAILLVPVKQELGVSDTAMGLLTGGAFALLYVVAGIPLARVADNGVRKTLFAICLVTWSLMTMFCGLAQTYVQLLVARMGVAVGEAGSMPASYSLIPDILPPEKRPGAIGLLYASGLLGIAASLYFGGVLSDAIGWRMTMVSVASPGLIVGLLFFFTVREPARLEPVAVKPEIREVLAESWQYPSFRCVIAAATAASIGSLAILGWAPTFLIRVHHMTAANVGALMGFGVVCSSVGSWLSGIVSNRLVKRSFSRLFWIPALGPLISLVPLVFFLTASDYGVLWVSYALYQGVFASWLPAAAAVAVNLSSARGRGLIAAILTIVQSIGGVAVGQVLVGMLNDYLTPSFGAEAVRYSLMIASTGVVGTAVSAAVGLLYIERDHAHAEARYAH